MNQDLYLTISKTNKTSWNTIRESLSHSLSITSPNAHLAEFALFSYAIKSISTYRDNDVYQRPYLGIFSLNKDNPFCTPNEQYLYSEGITKDYIILDSISHINDSS